MGPREAAQGLMTMIEELPDDAPDISGYDSDGFRNGGEDSSPGPPSAPPSATDNLPAKDVDQPLGQTETPVADTLVEAGLSTDPTTRLAEIQNLMAEGDHGPYWKGPHKDALQAEYRNLLDRQDDDDLRETAEPAQLAEGDVSLALDTLSGMGTIGAQFSDEIRGDGAKLTLQAMEDTRVGVLAEIGASANEVTMAFDGLDDNVRAAVYAEFSNPYVPQLPQADSADVAQFTQEASAGKILGAEWGDETPRKLANVLYRWDRLTERLSDTEMVELDDFWRHRLRANERAAILRKLAA